jgi:hypothetical protein
MYGFSFGMATLLLVITVFAIVTSHAEDICNRHSLMIKVGWLYLQCGEMDKALCFFETSASALEALRGASDYITVKAKVGTVMALHKCRRADAAHLLARHCLDQVDAALRCPRYMLEQMCLPTGSFSWMERLVEPLSVIRRCDWLAVRAEILAADGRADSDVMGALQVAVSSGLMPSDSKSVVNTLGDEQPQRFVQSSFAFAAITERADSESARTRTPSDLQFLEEKMHENFMKRWRLKTALRMIGCAGFVGILMIGMLLMIRAEHLHLNGKQCTSIKGIYLGISGCRVGRYCTLHNECVSCPTVAAGTTLPVDKCDAIDGEAGCCSATFARHCPASPFNCSF